MPDTESINRFLQGQLRRRGLHEVAAIEAAQWLGDAGILKDSRSRPGKPLRDLLRLGKIWGQRQELNGRWFIQPSLVARPESSVESRSAAHRWSATSEDDPESKATNSLQELRESYRPERVGVRTRVIMIGESAPKGGTFFYSANSLLFKSTHLAFVTAYGQVVGDGIRFLERYQRNGFFLTDLCHEPVNHLKDRNLRLAKRRAAEPRLAEQISELSRGAQIVTVMQDTVPNVKRAMAIANRTDLEINLSLPFPSWPNHARTYVDRLATFLRASLDYRIS